MVNMGRKHLSIIGSMDWTEIGAADEVGVLVQHLDELLDMVCKVVKGVEMMDEGLSHQHHCCGYRWIECHVD